jgi:general secretion pathway protein C
VGSANRQLRIVAAILLSSIAGSTVLFSQGVTQLIAASYLEAPPISIASAGPPTTLSAAQRQVDAMPILRRNMFDSQTGALDVLPEPDAPDPTEVETPVEPIDPNAPPPRCDGSMRLVGAFVRMQRPEDSFAAITDATGRSLLYQQGMSIDEREVMAIQYNRVILRPRSGSLCSLTMFDDGEQPRPATPLAIAPPLVAETAVESPEGLSAAELEAGITQVNDHEFTVDRGLVDRLLGNQAALMRTARVIPHEEGGQTVGVKIYGIRRASLLGRLGVQNGDMLRTINGYDMTSPDSALEAYARLRNADRITINVVRRGQPMTIDYSIR